MSSTTPSATRHDPPRSVPGLLFGVDRSTVTRAIGEVSALLAERGRAVPDRPGLRLRTLTDVFCPRRPVRVRTSENPHTPGEEKRTLTSVVPRPGCR
ncbi:hypothetical protein GCM10010240_07000 [Streptomyces griseoviridis]|nr:hypothetical protein GCM10010240_07000 [Streptomyces griseoviridis]